MNFVPARACPALQSPNQFAQQCIHKVIITYFKRNNQIARRTDILFKFPSLKTNLYLVVICGDGGGEESHRGGDQMPQAPHPAARI